MIPFNDLTSLARLHRGEYEAAIGRVLARGWFVLGPELEAFEAEFAAYCGAKHCVGVGNGLDALILILRSCEIGPDSEVFLLPQIAGGLTPA